MKRMDLRELQLCALNILKDVACFCDREGIRYSITDGTLLGAVRHGGFIPWDDDIDISMPREDYDKFFHMYKSDIYNAVEYHNNSKYPYPFGKVIDKRTKLNEMANYDYEMGVYIDVFPLDGLPDDPNERTKHIRKANFLGQLALYKKISPHYKTDVIHKMIYMAFKLLLFPISNRKIALQQIKHAKKYAYNFSDDVSVLVLRHTIFDGILKRTYSDNVIPIAFEGITFKCPQEYGDYLHHVYGNYMQLPPPEKRTAHSPEAFWK